MTSNDPTEVVFERDIHGECSGPRMLNSGIPCVLVTRHSELRKVLEQAGDACHAWYDSSDNESFRMGVSEAMAEYLKVFAYVLKEGDA